MRTVDLSSPANPRLQLFFPLAGALLLLLLTVLAWRQLVENPAYRAREERQAQRRILQPGPRGDILDRNGELLVGNRPRFSAVIFPDDLARLRPAFRAEYIRRVKAIREAARRTSEEPRIHRDDLAWEARIAVIQQYLDEVNAITGRAETVTRRDLERHFGQELLLPLTLVRDLEPYEYARLIEQLPVNHPLQIYTDTARYYPYGEAAAHVLGYVTATLLEPASELPGRDLTTFSIKGKIGKTGLERSFESTLQGRSGGEIYRVDPAGFQHERLEALEPRKGANLLTSLDIGLQIATEKAMGDKIGAAVALDVHTGEVLVLASRPAYNLNRLSPYIPTEVYAEITGTGAWLNRATQGLYPPGSTFKLITALAALRAGVLQPDTIIHSPKYFRVGNRLFPCHSRYGFGDINVTKALAVSSNTFFYNVGVQTGIDRIAAEARRFGLDAPQPLELPFLATRMVVPDMAWKRSAGHGGWVPGDTANTAIGQGFVLTTPLHMATFIASLGRGETRTTPTLLKTQALPGQPPVVHHGAEPIGLPPGHLAAITQGMIDAVNSGTAQFARLPHLQAGGKTGTAQVRKDGQELTLAWFVGLAPLPNPQLAVAIVIEGSDPGDNYHGGSTAAPIAKVIFENAFPAPSLPPLAAAAPGQLSP